MIKIITTAKEMQKYANEIIGQGRTIALIPTMGFLHEGHLSLIHEGCRHGDEVVVSIFVNPTQFGPGEDLEAYPRSFERDCRLAEEAGATLIFGPEAGDLYGTAFQTYVTLEHLPAHLCGISRPVHFRGVATVVTKLFNIVKPHVAVFGQKDFQQLLVIRQMVRDLNFDIKIIGGPIVREHDGLAMSSRNNYMTPEQRTQALCLYKSILKAQEMVKNGVVDAEDISKAVSDIITSHEETAIDYISICDPETLEPIQKIEDSALIALAVKVGKTRLIDNMLLSVNSQQ